MRWSCCIFPRKKQNSKSPKKKKKKRPKYISKNFPHWFRSRNLQIPTEQKQKTVKTQKGLATFSPSTPAPDHKRTIPPYSSSQILDPTWNPPNQNPHALLQFQFQFQSPNRTTTTSYYYHKIINFFHLKFNSCIKIFRIFQLHIQIPPNLNLTQNPPRPFFLINLNLEERRTRSFSRISPEYGSCKICFITDKNWKLEREREREREGEMGLWGAWSINLGRESYTATYRYD